MGAPGRTEQVRKLAINSPSKLGLFELLWTSGKCGKARWRKGLRLLLSPLTREGGTRPCSSSPTVQTRRDNFNVHALVFSSRSRHARLVSDWSSDVCSSD